MDWNGDKCNLSNLFLKNWYSFCFRENVCVLLYNNVSSFLLALPLRSYSAAFEFIQRGD